MTVHRGTPPAGFEKIALPVASAVRANPAGKVLLALRDEPAPEALAALSAALEEHFPGVDVLVVCGATVVPMDAP